jgi:hypothetical protein
MTTTPAMSDGKAMTEDPAVLDVPGRRSKAPGETSRSTEGEPMRSQLLAKIEEISKIFWETKQG